MRVHVIHRHLENGKASFYPMDSLDFVLPLGSLVKHPTKDQMFKVVDCVLANDKIYLMVEPADVEIKSLLPDW